jgi:3-carboxy-cis,cis-muconate cycloisomerase
MREFPASQLTAMVQDHERAVATQPLEWLLIPDAFVLTSGSLHHAKQLLGGLIVNSESMRRNLESGGGLLMAEAVMMGLAPHIGRLNAHELVTSAVHVAAEKKITLRDALQNNKQVTNILKPDQLDRLLDPSMYLGSAGAMIDSVLRRANQF